MAKQHLSQSSLSSHQSFGAAFVFLLLSLTPSTGITSPDTYSGDGSAGGIAHTAEWDKASLATFTEVQKLVKDVAPILDKAARRGSEATVRSVTESNGRVTSRDRNAASRIASTAHDRGAIDVVTPNMATSIAPRSCAVEIGRAHV